jgi:hypothetical protein
MTTKTYTKEQLIDVLGCGIGKKTDTGLVLLSDDIDGNSRFSIQHAIVFQDGEKFYRTVYSVGATEYQDESPFEYSGTDCLEVKPVQKLITVYEKA